jgi:hypothetical protein
MCGNGLSKTDWPLSVKLSVNVGAVQQARNNSTELR